MKQLEQIMADWHETAQALRRAGREGDAVTIERLLSDVKAGAEDYLRPLSEEEAMNWSGKSREWLRIRFAGWEQDGHAWRDGRKRIYRAVVVPHRLNVEALREDAKREADAAA